MRQRFAKLGSSLVLITAVACGPPAARDGSGVDGGFTSDAGLRSDAGPQQPLVDASTAGCTKIDVLFVIDNSGSMGEEQSNLIANFPMFISVLDQSGLDYRVAVTTTARQYSYAMTFPFGGGTIPMSTGSGDNGTMLQPAGCNMPRRWIEKNDPDKTAMFSCVANVGTSGNADEMPLGAMRDAFEDRMQDGTNLGFRRPDALLGVVMLTDEDDCSYEQSVTLGFTESLCESQMEPTMNYVSFLDQYTGHRSRWSVAAIAGMGPGQCSSAFGSAAEAKRLKAFVQQAGANARMSSICDGDLSVSLAETLALFESACGGIIL
jgi:hypothetical protein